ncbi:unnamed protein product [Arctogadus glacialis]
MFVPSFRLPTEYTGELIGIDYLYLQTGKCMQDMDPEGEETEQLLEDLEDEAEDEGFTDDTEASLEVYQWFLLLLLVGLWEDLMPYDQQRALPRQLILTNGAVMSTTSLQLVEGNQTTFIQRPNSRVSPCWAKRPRGHEAPSAASWAVFLLTLTVCPSRLYHDVICLCSAVRRFVFGFIIFGGSVTF